MDRRARPKDTPSVDGSRLAADATATHSGGISADKFCRNGTLAEPAPAIHSKARRGRDLMASTSNPEAAGSVACRYSHLRFGLGEDCGVVFGVD